MITGTGSAEFAGPFCPAPCTTRNPAAPGASCTAMVFETPFAAVAVTLTLPRLPVGDSKPDELIVAFVGSLTDQKIGVAIAAFAASLAIALNCVFELALYKPAP